MVRNTLIELGSLITTVGVKLLAAHVDLGMFYFQLLNFAHCEFQNWKIYVVIQPWTQLWNVVILVLLIFQYFLSDLANQFVTFWFLLQIQAGAKQHKQPIPAKQCFTCKKVTTIMKQCACKTISYCSKECQVKDWKRHKGEHVG